MSQTEAGKALAAEERMSTPSGSNRSYSLADQEKTCNIAILAATLYRVRRLSSM